METVVSAERGPDRSSPRQTIAAEIEADWPAFRSLHELVELGTVQLCAGRAEQVVDLLVLMAQVIDADFDDVASKRADGPSGLVAEVVMRARRRAGRHVERKLGDGVATALAVDGLDVIEGEAERRANRGRDHRQPARERAQIGGAGHQLADVAPPDPVGSI